MNNDNSSQDKSTNVDHDNTAPAVSTEQVQPITVQPIAQANPAVAVPNAAPPARASADTSQNTHLKSLLIKMMLGCLVAAASVAVFAILAGSMGEVAWRAIATIFSAIIHIALLFAVISVAASKNPLMQRTNNFVVNTSIVITIMSFFTSIFSTWEIMTGSLPAKLYVTYAVVIFLVLHGKTLMDVEVLYNKVRPYVYANYAFMALVGCMILGVVYIDDALQLLDGFYGRLLAAAAIVDVTLSMVVAVMYRLYLQKHPELKENHAQTGNSAGKIIVAILLFLFVVWPLMSVVLAFSRY